ncbi:MAG: anthranilate phosphoribosyltransferase [bacterium]|nr:anthranilate phosphoribosyltransferase [bacterium]
MTELKNIVEGNSLTTLQAYELCKKIINNEISDIIKAAFLTALRVKGESYTEIAGFAKCMRENSTSFEHNFEFVVDVVGTGADRIKTINVSSLAAITVATRYPVAKHGNRAITGVSGSADFFEMAGVDLNMEVQKVKEKFQKTKFAFLFAPLYHPAMKNVMPVRKELGIRTIFNLLGPISNPLKADYMLLGVFNEEYAEKIAKALYELKAVKKAWVVSSGDCDEILLDKKTVVFEVGSGLKRFELTPSDFGLQAKTSAIEVKSKDESFKKSMQVLEGEFEEGIKIVAANAGALLHIISGKPIKEEVINAYNIIKQKKALEVLKQYVNN